MIETQEPGVRIIDKTGPLANPADRDHCIQYMVAIPLIFGRLTAADYEDDGRRAIRASMRCARRCRCARTRRSPASTTPRTSATSAMRCRCSSATAAPRERVQVDFPIGHRRRRAEGMPVLVKKFEASVDAHFAPEAGGAHQGAVRQARAARCPAGERAHGSAGDQRVGRGGLMTPAGGRSGRPRR